MGNGFRFPLMLTKEMKKAKNRLAVIQDTELDFAVGLKIFRAGLIVYDVLPNEELQSMYVRKLILDEEAEFLIGKGLVAEDFRPVTVEKIHQANEVRLLHKQFEDTLLCWKELKPRSKTWWIKEARKYPDLASAKKLLEVAVHG